MHVRPRTVMELDSMRASAAAPYARAPVEPLGDNDLKRCAASDMTDACFVSPDSVYFGERYRVEDVNAAIESTGNDLGRA